MHYMSININIQLTLSTSCMSFLTLCMYICSSDSSGFTLVSRRKARAASATVRPKGVESSERYNGPSVEEVVRKVHSYRYMGGRGITRRMECYLIQA